jgi:hypothetical protein
MSKFTACGQQMIGIGVFYTIRVFATEKNIKARVNFPPKRGEILSHQNKELEIPTALVHLIY